MYLSLFYAYNSENHNHPNIRFQTPKKRTAPPPSILTVGGYRRRTYSTTARSIPARCIRRRGTTPSQIINIVIKTQRTQRHMTTDMSVKTAAPRNEIGTAGHGETITAAETVAEDRLG